MTQKSLSKKMMILAGAHQVFVRKGFHAVTMTDIVEQCGISRGGLYRYFNSTEEIFRSLLMESSKKTHETFTAQMEAAIPFQQIMDAFWTSQRIDLTEIHDSIMTAAYEFFLSHRNAEDRELLHRQQDHSITELSRLIDYGVQRGEIQVEVSRTAAAHIVIFLEGLRVLALSTDLTEDFIREQLDFIQIHLYERSV
ncbi:TetR/AcrR family transcriptional regulator [Paenibacillus polymyxa]